MLITKLLKLKKKNFRKVLLPKKRAEFIRYVIPALILSCYQKKVTLNPSRGSETKGIISAQEIDVTHKGYWISFVAENCEKIKIYYAQRL